MKRLLLASALLLTFGYANAVDPNISPFAQAITQGHVSAPLPNSPETLRVSAILKEETKSKGEITAEFDRITLFKSQPNCGRVRMMVVQKSTKTYWPKISAQMNVCSNGLPPLRQCAGLTKLVPADQTCSDGSKPVDTPEVAAAIAKSIKDGALTPDQIKNQPESSGAK